MYLKLTFTFIGPHSAYFHFNPPFSGPVAVVVSDGLVKDDLSVLRWTSYQGLCFRFFRHRTTLFQILDHYRLYRSALFRKKLPLASANYYSNKFLSVNRGIYCVNYVTYESGTI